MADRESNLVPFERGNQAAVKHGAYSLLQLAPRANALADELRDLVPAQSEADGPAIDALAITLAQVERAAIILGRAQADDTERVRRGDPIKRGERDELVRLQQDLRGWINSATRLLDQLALTPTSRARLGLDVVRGRLTLTRLAALAEAGGGDGNDG